MVLFSFLSYLSIFFLPLLPSLSLSLSLSLPFLYLCLLFHPFYSFSFFPTRLIFFYRIYFFVSFLIPWFFPFSPSHPSFLPSFFPYLIWWSTPVHSPSLLHPSTANLKCLLDNFKRSKCHVFLLNCNSDWCWSIPISHTSQYRCAADLWWNKKNSQKQIITEWSEKLGVRFYQRRQKKGRYRVLNERKKELVPKKENRTERRKRKKERRKRNWRKQRKIGTKLVGKVHKNNGIGKKEGKY